MTPGAAALSAFLAAAAGMDIVSGGVDRRFLAAGILAGVLLPAVPDMAWHSRLPGVIPGIVLLILSKAGAGVGPADGLVLLTIGLSAGMRGACAALTVACFVSCPVAGLLLILGRRCGSNARRKQIPFLPFLFAGWAAFLLWFSG